MAKEENVMTMDMLKAELLSSSKGNFMSVLGESQEGEFLNSTAMDLNRILSGTLNKSVKTLTHTGLVGPEASGKSSIMCLMLADAQKKGYLPVVIDAEGAWTNEFVKRWGMDPSNVIRIQSMWVDEIQIELGRWIDKDFRKLAIAVDSIGALELRKMIDDSKKGDVKADQGRLQKEIKRMLKMLVSIAKFQDSVIFSAGHYYGNPTGYGEPEKIGGGNYYRLSCDNIITLKKFPIYENPNAATKALKGKIIGNKIKAATLKNRDYPPFQEAQVEIDYKTGVNSFAGMIDLCINMGLIEKKGSWYSCDILGLKEQGEIKLENAIKEVDNKPLLEAIEEILKTTGYSTINESLELSVDEPEDEFE